MCDRGGRDKTSQIHDNANSRKDKIIIKCYACGKYEHYAIEYRNEEHDEEANFTFTNDEEPPLMLAEKMPNLLMLKD